MGPGARQSSGRVLAAGQLRARSFLLQWQHFCAFLQIRHSHGNCSLTWHASSLQRKEKRLVSSSWDKMFPHQQLTSSAAASEDAVLHSSQPEKSGQFTVTDSREIWDKIARSPASLKVEYIFILQLCTSQLAPGIQICYKKYKLKAFTCKPSVQAWC